jgi:cytochrome c-type biogenesis protein
VTVLLDLPHHPLADGYADTVTGGPLPLALAVAALAGLLSFLSPCVLPLVPGYLSYLTGLTGSTLNAPAGGDPSGAVATKERTSARTGARTGRVLAGVGLFVAGFTAVFTVLGFAAGGAGAWLAEHAPVLERVVGVLVIAMGLAYLGVLSRLVPALDRTVRPSAPPAGLAGAPLLGAVFALGWVPCVSPTLAAVLGLAYVEGSAARGVLLAVAYCAGLGIPFLLVGLGVRAVAGAVSVVRRHGRWVTRIGGALLVAVGLLLVTGAWNDLVIWLRGLVGPGEIGI